MNVVVLIAIIIGLVISLAAYITSRTAAIDAKRAVIDAKAAVVIANQASMDLSAKTEQVHALVNSNLTLVKKDLEDAKNTILTLKLLVEKLSGKNINFATKVLFSKPKQVKKKKNV